VLILIGDTLGMRMYKLSLFKLFLDGCVDGLKLGGNLELNAPKYESIFGGEAKGLTKGELLILLGKAAIVLDSYREDRIKLKKVLKNYREDRIEIIKGLNSYHEDRIETRKVQGRTIEKLRLVEDEIITFMQQYEHETQKKLDSFSIGRKKGGQARKDAAQPMLDAIAMMNADLLQRPVIEGWASSKKRAHHIAEKVGRKPSYVKRLIATPRKTKQS